MSVNTKIIAKNSSGKGGTTIIRTVGGGGDFSAYDGSTIPQLNVDTLNVNNIEAAVTNSSAIVAGNIDTSNINSNTAEITELANQSLVSETITTGAIKGSFGEIDKVKAEEIVTQFLETDTIKSKDIVTDNLTVLGSAHFFELVLDKIKSVGGAVILSPADGFELYAYSTLQSYVSLFWRADQGSISTTNMWEAGDLALCQNFNQAAAGTNQQISNTFCWSKVTTVNPNIINIWRRAFNSPTYVSPENLSSTHPVWRKSEFFLINGIMYRNTTDDTVIDALAYEQLDPSEQINYEEYSTAYGRVDPNTGETNYISKAAYDTENTVSYEGNDYYIRVYSQIDVVKCHQIVISSASGNCATGSTFTFKEGDTFVQLGHQQRTTGNNVETAEQAALRQNAIYLSSYSSLDADLKAPLIAQYTGINDFNLSSHKYTWFAGGSNNPNVPANNIRGNIVMSSGTTYKDYVDNRVDDALDNIMVDQFTVELDTNNFFVPAQNQPPYYILGNSTFTTNIALYNNGVEWSMNNAPTTTVRGVTFTANDVRPQSAPHYKYLITINTTQIESWYGINPFTIPITVNFNDNNYPPKTFTRTINIYLNKLIQGENGSATAVAFGMYELVPRNEEINVNENGVLGLNLRYSLGSVNVQSDGTTTIDPLTTWPSSLSVTMRHDKLASADPDIAFENETSSGVIRYKKYVNSTFISDYFSLLDTPNTCPTYFTIYLKNNGNVIQQKIIPIMMNGGATFKLNSDSISAAVSQSKTYTDGEISDVNDDISDLNDSLTTTNSNVSQLRIDVNGIQNNVSSLQTTVNNQGTLINQKVDQSTFDQTSQSITSRVSSCETDINNLDADLNNNYYTKNETDSEIGQAETNINNNLSTNYYTRTQTQTQINQTASTISATVESNISGQLRQTGINIGDGIISLNSKNTNINGNLEIKNSDNGLTLYDSNGNPKIQIMNNTIGNYENYNSNITVDSWTRDDGTQTTGTWSLKSNKRSLGTRTTNSTVTLSSISVTEEAVDANDGNITYPSGTCSMIIKFYKEGSSSFETSSTITLTSQGNGRYTYSNNVNFTPQYNANYYCIFEVTNSSTLSSLLKATGAIYSVVNYTSNNMTRLGLDGFASNPAANCFIWSNNDAQILRHGNNGIKVVDSSPDGNGCGIKVLGRAQVNNNPTDTWFGYSNMTPTKILGASDFENGTVYYNGGSHNKKRYVINPNDGYSVYIVAPDDSSGNNYYVVLPNSLSVPKGWHVKVMKLRPYSGNSYYLYVTSSQNMTYIQDGNLNNNTLCSINNNPTHATFYNLYSGYTNGAYSLRWRLQEDV